MPAAALEADDVVWGCDDAGYAGPTTEYPHGVLGDDVEYKSLVLLVHTQLSAIPATLDLPDGQVFEDVAPRCADLDGDGEDEVVTVISHADAGASLAVFSKRNGPVDATPPIGTRFRWLAPAAIADFDGDGQNDIAYVETPHLAGILRFLTLRDGKLVELASKPGFSNHKIGEDFITGGSRDCGEGIELVIPDLAWNELLAVRLVDAKIVETSIAQSTEADSVTAAMACETE